MRTEDVSALIQDVCARTILPRFRALAPGDVAQKSPGDLVTVADKEAEAELTNALRAADPGALVVGEEAAFVAPELVAALPDAAAAWVIDPVDGTGNFAAGREDFGVMVAEVRHGVAVRSWIWQPMHERLYVAERGAGATCNGRRLARLAGRRRPYRVETFRALRRTPAVGLALSHTRGSCAIDYPRVVAGDVDALGYRTINPWDHLPGSLLLTELGGFVGLDGAAYRPGGAGRLLFAAAARDIHDAVADALSDRLER